MKIGILIIHGMGDQKKNFCDDFIEKIKEQYTGKVSLVFEPIYWAKVLSKQERRILENTDIFNLNYTEHLRPFVVNYLADVIAYQKTFERKDFKKKNKGEFGDRGIYHIIQQLISGKISRLKTKIGECNPIVMIGHSLGSIMLLNYLHDVQKSDKDKIVRDWHYEDNFNLAGLITMGSPLALWLLRYKNFGKAIRFPLDSTGRDFRSKAKWINFYDKDDILAYPLKELNNSFQKLKSLEDREVNAGNILQKWNPASHNGYMNTRKVIEQISLFIDELSLIPLKNS